ncbi:hypothetical protein [Thermovibrio sp.]
MLRFNFAELKESKFEKYLKADLIFLLTVVSVAVGAGIVIENSLRKEINRTQREISALRSELNRLKSIQREERKLLSRERELKKKLKIVSRLDKNREVPKPLYFFASRDNVKGVWLNSLEITQRKVKVNGNIWNIDNFPDFLAKVDEKIGTVLFKEVKRVNYQNKSLNLNLSFYNFEFEAERK